MLIARIQGCFESDKLFYSWHARCEMEEEGMNLIRTSGSISEGEKNEMRDLQRGRYRAENR